MMDASSSPPKSATTLYQDSYFHLKAWTTTQSKRLSKKVTTKYHYSISCNKTTIQRLLRIAAYCHDIEGLIEACDYCPSEKMKLALELQKQWEKASPGFEEFVTDGGTNGKKRKVDSDENLQTNAEQLSSSKWTDIWEWQYRLLTGKRFVRIGRKFPREYNRMWQEIRTTLRLFQGKGVHHVRTFNNPSDVELMNLLGVMSDFLSLSDSKILHKKDTARTLFSWLRDISVLEAVESFGDYFSKTNGRREQ